MTESTELDRLRKHLDQVQQLLTRHRLVESLVNRQEMPRHELDDSLSQRQSKGELAGLLANLSAIDVARILESLAPEDRLAAWNELQEERLDGLLTLLSDEVREVLATAPYKSSDRGSLNAFDLFNGRLHQVKISRHADLSNIKPIWVDMIAPTDEERLWIGEHFDVELPDPQELTDLEASARFYVEDRNSGPALHLLTDFLLDSGTAARGVAVAFILYRDILFSVRCEELPAFRLQRLRARTEPGYVTEGKDVLLDLYAADAEYSADALEDVYAGLESIGNKVLHPQISDEEAAHVLAEIARSEDLNGRTRRNVLDTRRAVSFLMRGKLLSTEQHNDARQLLRDLESLDSHTTFLFGKINFLMDATVGFININQNKRISKLTTISVIFMPIAVMASIGGMSEYTMAMLDVGVEWPLAYSLFVVGAACVGFLTWTGLRWFEARYSARGILARLGRLRLSGERGVK